MPRLSCVEGAIGEASIFEVLMTPEDFNAYLTQIAPTLLGGGSISLPPKCFLWSKGGARVSRVLKDQLSELLRLGYVALVTETDEDGYESECFRATKRANEELRDLCPVETFVNVTLTVSMAPEALDADKPYLRESLHRLLSETIMGAQFDADGKLNFGEIVGVEVEGGAE